MFHNNIISFITSPPGVAWLTFLKIAFIVFSAFMILAIVVMISWTSWLRVRFLQDIVEFFTYRPLGIKKLARQWAKVQARLETGLESEYKLAVIEADSMFDDVVQRMGYRGESLGERLDKVSKDIMPSVEEVKLAHQTRNNIVHDPDYKLELEEAKNALAAYEKALVDLGAL